MMKQTSFVFSETFEREHVYHCVASPFLLTTVWESLGSKDINCCSFQSEFLI